MKCSALPCDLKIGIIGAGQLGLMLFQQGIRLGLKFNVLGQKGDPLCKYTNCFKDSDYKKFVDESDLVTYEFEHASWNAMEYAEINGKLRPGLNAVLIKREREKEFLYLKDVGVPMPNFEIAEDGMEALEIAKNNFDSNAVIKRSVGGYDGKGQYFLKGDLEKYQFLKKDPNRYVVVEYVDFDYEASIISSSNGRDILHFPPSFNLNKKGILILNYGPIRLEGAEEISNRIIKHLKYVGTLGIELFVKDKKLMVNEISPRVHNSGHYSLDLCEHSQFELHLRGISGMDLLDPKCSNYFGMVNILGKNIVESELENKGRIFMYSKEGNNPRRKVGHINFRGNSLEEVKLKSDQIVKELYGSIENLIEKI